MQVIVINFTHCMCQSRFQDKVGVISTIYKGKLKDEYKGEKGVTTAAYELHHCTSTKSLFLSQIVIISDNIMGRNLQRNRLQYIFIYLLLFVVVSNQVSLKDKLCSLAN